MESDLRALERVFVVEMALLAVRIDYLERHLGMANPFDTAAEQPTEPPPTIEAPPKRVDPRTSHAGQPRPSCLGALLREERRRRGWTQERMAQEVAISRETLSHVETGRITMPEHAVLQRIVRRLGLSPSTLVDSLELDDK